MVSYCDFFVSYIGIPFERYIFSNEIKSFEMVQYTYGFKIIVVDFV